MYAHASRQCFTSDIRIFNLWWQRCKKFLTKYIFQPYNLNLCQHCTKKLFSIFNNTTLEIQCKHLLHSYEVWNSHFNIRLTPVRILNIRLLVATATCRISNFSFCEVLVLCMYFLLCILLTIHTFSFFPLLESRFFVGKNATLRKPHCKWHSITHRCLKHRLTAEKKVQRHVIPDLLNMISRDQIVYFHEEKINQTAVLHAGIMVSKLQRCKIPWWWQNKSNIISVVFGLFSPISTYLWQLWSSSQSPKTCDTRFFKYRKKDKSKYCVVQTSWLEIVTLQNPLMLMNWI